MIVDKKYQTKIITILSFENLPCLIVSNTKMCFPHMMKLEYQVLIEALNGFQHLTTQ